MMIIFQPQIYTDETQIGRDSSFRVSVIRDSLCRWRDETRLDL
jgi:hypothetical protein